MDHRQLASVRVPRRLIETCLALVLFTASTHLSAATLVGIEVDEEQQQQRVDEFSQDGTQATVAFSRITVLYGESVPRLLLITEAADTAAGMASPDVMLRIPGVNHAIPGIAQEPIDAQSFSEYTLVALRLTPGVTFAQCEAQMAKLLKLAKRYGAHPLETWRVEGQALGLPDADLFGVVGWSSGASALRFALKLRSEGQGFFRAHDLNDENALVVQVKPI